MVGSLVIAVLIGATIIAAALYFGLRARTPPAVVGPDIGAEIDRLRAALLEAQSIQRQELSGAVAQSQQGITAALVQQIGELTNSNAQRLDSLRGTVDNRLKELQADNAGKLDEMRKTVDEKLQTTLETRLGQSFKLVSERLEQVQRGLGEMQGLAIGVGDLKRVLTNVKTRGTWGEVQLQALLEQILPVEQYGRNVATRPGSNERVEFAVKFPGQGDMPCWLPIDAKFPREDYERLLEAQDRADPVAVEEAGRALERCIRDSARSIRDKYVESPHTTDFALLYLPTEGLYAEVLRRPGVADALQREFRVSVAGPTTITALLNSLQMGFRTLAIEKRSSEVWQVLAAVKTEFARYGELLDKVKKKLDEASNQLEQTNVRSRAISRRLKDVEGLPKAEATALLPPAEGTEPEEP